MTDVNGKPVHAVSVRDLVTFVLRSGDLGGERQFVGSNRALAGIRGQQKIQRSRPKQYRTEIAVEHTIDAGEFLLKIRGRIDGLLETPDELLLEEIKTVQGRWDHTADPLHWAQARFYGFIYGQDHPHETVVLQLTYLELESGEVTELRETCSRSDLAEFFHQTTSCYIEWLREQHAWRRVRDDSIRALAFPFSSYRRGQRELAVAAYRTLANGGRLFLEAPTGIGKTLSTLFPAVKALGEGKLERIFYLTARTVGRTIAEAALVDMRRGGLRLRSVTLIAKEKVCVRDGQPCDPLACPLSLGYYNRIKPALREALAQEAITRPALDAVAAKHQVCPFELSLDVSNWADVVIGDYNYAFDPQVYLRRHFDEGGGGYGFLVDEAHNLVDRAREMFSADLDSREILAVKRAIKETVPRCARALTKLLSALRAAGAEDNDASTPPAPSDPSVELNLFPTPSRIPGASRDNVMTRRELPEEWMKRVDDALAEAERWLVRNEPAEFRDDLLALYFRLHTFRRTAEGYDERYVTLIESGSALKVRLFCVDPSHLLRQALERGKAAIFFSATLTPVDYHRELLGGQPDDPVLQLASPFPPEHLAVLVQDRIQTHLKGRAESVGEVVESIAALLQGRSGNYLVYFPSYQYLNAVAQAFQSRHSGFRILVQTPGMTESERETFLSAFSVDHKEHLVGFAVLGGIFGEGIDLVGERLIGAIIVGVGLPQLCVERDLIRGHFAGRNVPGFEYAYTYPGINRVLQAVGRVIRSERDRGVVLLIDARFGEARYRRLFPPWWKLARVRHPSTIQDAVQRFWNEPPA